MTQPTIIKPKPPLPKDWREQVENKIKDSGHGKKDVLDIIWLAQELQDEMGPLYKWMSDQTQYLNGIAGEYMRIYMTRFSEQPPPRPQKEPSREILIDTPERRKEKVREVALAIAKPGDEINNEIILGEFKRQGMRLFANNPEATISTILNGFKSEFEKAKDEKTNKLKKGVFKRKQTGVSLKPSNAI